VVLNLDGRRHRVFDRAPVVMAEARAHVADPRGDDAPNASGPDQLIEEHVGDGPDEGEIPALLADQLMPGGKGNERLDRGIETDGAAVRDEAGDSLPQGGELGAGHPPILPRRPPSSRP
jgi:hypothetical protein